MTSLLVAIVLGCGQTAPAIHLSSPLNGEANVPTNAFVGLRLVGPQSHASDALAGLGIAVSSLDDDGGVGAAVPLRFDDRLHPNQNEWRIRAVPQAPLSPQTRYVVSWSPDGGPSQPLGTFTTGDGGIDGGPGLPLGITATLGQAPASMPTCEADTVLKTLKLALPGSQPLLFDVIDNTGDERTVTVDEEFPGTGFVLCSGSLAQPLDQGWLLFPGNRSLFITATDRAGNVSPGVELSIDAFCDEGSQQAFGADKPPGACEAGAGAPLLLIAIRTVLLRGRRR